MEFAVHAFFEMSSLVPEKGLQLRISTKDIILFILKMVAAVLVHVEIVLHFKK